MKQVTIVGGGIGGLTSAIRLLNKGYKVRIIEKENRLGGKVNLLEHRRARFDLTASIIMTPNAYIDIFRECNRDYKDYFSMQRLEYIYKAYNSYGSSYEFNGDINKLIEDLERVQNGLSEEYLEFLYKSNLKYIVSKKYILDRPMINIKELLNIKTISNLLKINPIQSSKKYLDKVISNNEIKKILLFQSMYIGINPYKESNLYTLIPAISQMYGLWYIEGGLYSYIEALERLIRELGGKIILNTNVVNIDVLNRIVATDKQEYTSDIIINNTDYPYAKHELMNNKYKDVENSCSVFMIYLGLNRKYEDLQVHNIYIGSNQKRNMYDIFTGKLSENMDMYIYYPSKIDRSISGEYESIMNIMVRVPNLSYNNIIWNDETIRKYRDCVIKQIKNIEELKNIENDIEYESYLTPKVLKEKFNTYDGNAFGISHKLSQSGYMRANMVDKKIDDLYHIGASTHPGNGVSVIIEGSKVLVNEIIKRGKDK